MDLDYCVLRIEDEVVRGGALERLGPAGAALEVDAGTPTDKITLESGKLSVAQAQEAARDPANVVAPVMPVTLVQPCNVAEFGIAGGADPVASTIEAKQAWGIAEVGADKTSLTGAGVRVAILDTGITSTHPAFAGVTRIERNFTAEGESSDVIDRNGHGTHCAGTILGRDVDGVRIGIARGVNTTIIGKVLDAKGRGLTANVLRALQWAAHEKANIISMSLGFDFPGMQKRLQDAGRPAMLATSIALKAYRDNLRQFETLIAFLLQENADSPGTVIVAASGNESLRNKDPEFVIDTSLPAAASANIISVGATMQAADGIGIAPFSNINPVLCAPGVNIVSADRGTGLVAMSGTSMACPHVAGLASLWWEAVTRDVDRATGGLVRAKVVASARVHRFPAGIKMADRGAGQAMAPLPQ